MTGKQVSLLVRNTLTDFNVISSDSDLALDFSFLGFRAIIISLITITGDIFWKYVLLSAVCLYILILLEEDGCTAVRKPPPLSCPACCRGARDFLAGEWMRLPGGQLALPGGRDFCNEGTSWEENPASRT